MNIVLLILIVFVGPMDDAALEQRVMTFSQQLRCLVCQNETIADSHAELAADLRQQIREQMIAGRSEAEITIFLTDRYGEFVLYRPRVTPKTYALWFGPFALLAGVLYALYRFLKRWPWSMEVRTLTDNEHRRAAKLLRFAEGPNVAVYREQFAEMEADFRSGAVMREQYERDREDLERRLLDDCRELWGQTAQSPNSKKTELGD